MAGIFQNKVDTMVPDALAPYVAKSSAALSNKWLPIFHEEKFHFLGPSQCWEMTENTNIFVFSDKFNTSRVNNNLICMKASHWLCTWKCQTYCSMKHICVVGPGHHWFSTCVAPSHYLTHWWFITNWIIRYIFYWHFYSKFMYFHPGKWI